MNTSGIGAGYPATSVDAGGKSLPQSATANGQSGKVDLRNVSINEINALIKSGVPGLLDVVPMISPQTLEAYGYDPERIGQHRVDLIGQVETAIEFSKSIGEETAFLEKVLENLSRIDGMSLPSFPGRGSDSVNISETGRQNSEQALNRVDHAQPKLLSLNSRADLLEFGATVLGGDSQIEKWRAKGLQISEQSIIQAAETFREGFQVLAQKGSPRSQGLSINNHLIVMNSQDTPEWFAEEYRNLLAATDDKEMSGAFQRGETFYLSKHTPQTLRALQGYASG